ncbi:hypothetical protein H4219_001297 [Mycoemilia scoparia]|uniref:PROP1-like PPR domain-containing protein n=1 Tax=Mycoemilia scoparia TaxID=417184 RepID=A0A9W8DS06_9FUNG|nr:hypothetical protein H4219_001297 [Mycoemilia scoparia]
MYFQHYIPKANLHSLLTTPLSRSGLNVVNGNRNVHSLYSNARPIPHREPWHYGPCTQAEATQNHPLSTPANGSIRWHTTRRISRRVNRSDPIFKSPEAQKILSQKRGKDFGFDVTDQEVSKIYDSLMGLRVDDPTGANGTTEESFGNESSLEALGADTEADFQANGAGNEAIYGSEPSTTKNQSSGYSTFQDVMILNTQSARLAEQSRIQLYDKAGPEKLEELQLKNGLHNKSKSPSSDAALTVEDFNKVIGVNARLGRVKEAETAFHLLKDAGIAPTTKTHNMMINAYGMAGKLDKAVEAFKSIEVSGLKPDVYAYGSLIKAYVRNSRLEDAFHSYELMKEKKMWPTPIVYNTLISGCLRAYDYKRAWGVFEHIKYEAGKADQYSYSMMINACAKNNQVEKALNLFDEMIAEGIEPNDVTCNSLINACAREPRYFDDAFALLDKMELMGFAPDYFTYNTLIYACVKKKQLRLARDIFARLFNRVKVDESGLVKIDDVTFTNLFLALSNHLPRAKSWSRKTAKLGGPEKPNQNAGELVGGPQDVASYAETTEIELPSDVPLLPRCPETLSEVATEAKILYNHFLDNVHTEEVPISPQFLLAYMAVLLNVGNYEAAWDVYVNEFPRLKVKYTGWIYLRALECCERTRNLDRAWIVWNQFKAWQNQSESMIQAHSLKVPDEQPRLPPVTSQKPAAQGSRSDSSAAIGKQNEIVVSQNIEEVALMPMFAENQSKALTPREQESIRTKIGRSKDMEHRTYKMMINLLGKNDKFDDALPLIKELKDGLPYCRHDLSIKDFTTIYSRAVQTENPRVQAKLLELCRPEANLIQRRLNRKWNTPIPFDVGKRKRAALRYKFSGTN